MLSSCKWCIWLNQSNGSVKCVRSRGVCVSGSVYDCVCSSVVPVLFHDCVSSSALGLLMISYWYVLKITLVVCAYAAIVVGGALALAKIAQWMFRKPGVLSYVMCFVALVVIASLVLWLAMLGGDWM